MKNAGTLELKTLVKKTESKFINLKKAKLWDATPKDEIILALQAKTAELERKQYKSSKKDNKIKKEKQDDKKSKKRKTRTSKNASRDDGWIFKPPNPGKEDKEIKRDRKIFNWCTHHNKWVIKNSRYGIHTSDTCSLKQGNKRIKRETKK